VDEGAAQVRAARPGDGAQVWPLAREFATSFRPESSAFEATFAALIRRHDTLVVVAETPGAGIVGYLLASSHGTFLANGPVAWIEELMVAPSARRSGVGRALVEAAEEWAGRIPAAYIALASRRAGAFYRRLAYQDSVTYFRKDLAT